MIPENEPKLLGGGGTPSNDPTRQQFDVRDSITALVGKGYTSVSDDDARGHFAKLSSVLGVPAAQKIMSHIFLYNQSPNSKQLPIQQKIMQFYDMGSRDADVDAHLKKLKMLGSGVLGGMNTSPEVTNMDLSNRDRGKDAANPIDKSIVQSLVAKMGK